MTLEELRRPILESSVIDFLVQRMEHRDKHKRNAYLTALITLARHGKPVVFDTSPLPADRILDDLRGRIFETYLINVLLKQLSRDETRKKARHAFVRLATHGQRISPLYCPAVYAHCWTYKRGCSTTNEPSGPHPCSRRATWHGDIWWRPKHFVWLVQIRLAFNRSHHFPISDPIEDEFREEILKSYLIKKLKKRIVDGGVKVDNVIEALAKFCTIG